MDSFRLCETYLLHIKLFVANQSAISPFLGVFERPRALTKKFGLKESHGWDLLEQTCVFTGIQFIKHFMEFIVKTNQFLGSNANASMCQEDTIGNEAF